jgi:hypothetical protein
MVGFRVTEDALSSSIVWLACLVSMPDGETDDVDRPVTKLACKLLDSIGNLIGKLCQDFLVMDFSRILPIGHKRRFQQDDEDVIRVGIDEASSALRRGKFDATPSKSALADGAE